MIDHKAAKYISERENKERDDIKMPHFVLPDSYLDLRRLVREYFDALESRLLAESKMNVANDNFSDSRPECAAYLVALNEEIAAHSALRAAIEQGD